jgi:hypothetical protein
MHVRLSLGTGSETLQYLNVSVNMRIYKTGNPPEKRKKAPRSKESE